jgi:cell division protein FtsB
MPIVLAGRWKQRLKPLILPGLMGLLLLYTSDQLLTGERGIVTWRVMKSQLVDLNEDVNGIKADIARLESHIARLKGVKGRPDADFLDELVRRELGYVTHGDKIILRTDLIDK